MKKMKRVSTLLALFCAFVFVLASFTVSAATRELIASENVEGASGKMTDLVDGTMFTWPFPGGDKLVKVAKKSEPATKDYVLEGSQSVYFLNTGASAVGALDPLMTAFPKGSPADFKPEKTYVVRFLMKQIAPYAGPKDKLSITVRTWAWEDKWVEFGFLPDEKNGLSVKLQPGSDQMYAKGAIQRIGDDTYEVALRFNGVPNNTNCYLFWHLDGEGGFSIDDLKVYETKDDPKKLFEKNEVAAPVVEPSSEAPAPSETPVVSDKEEAPEASSEEEEKTEPEPSQTSDQNTDTVVSEAPQTSDDAETEAKGLSTGAIVAIVVAAVLVVGAIVVIIIMVVKGKKKETFESTEAKDE